MSNNLPVEKDRLKLMLSSDSVKQRFSEILGQRAPAFMSSVISAVNSNPGLKKCEPMSVIQSAAIAAAMDLPITPGLGFAHIVPYGDVAQFQMGWKGFVQLAMRSGQYRTINAAPVFEGQIKFRNPFTGEIEFDFEARSTNVIGYLLYFKLLNGYEKFYYMTKEECEKHGKRYSKQYAYGKGQWADNFEAMALKTVVKQGLSKYGILSVEMQKAIETDQGSVLPDGTVRYDDNPQEETAQDGAKKAKGKSRLSKLVEDQSAQPDQSRDVSEAPTQGQQPSQNETL